MNQNPDDCYVLETDDNLLFDDHQHTPPFSMITDLPGFSQSIFHLSLDDDITKYSEDEINLLSFRNYSQRFNLDNSICNIDISKHSINCFIGQFNNYLMEDNFNDEQQKSLEFNEIHYLKCPICLKHMKKLFCPNCIKNGDFTHSKKNFLERFADKKLKFIKLKEQQMHISNIVRKYFNNEIIKENLITKIINVQRNIKILNKIFAEKSSIINELKTLLDKTERERLKCHKKQITLKECIYQVKNQLASKSVNINNYFLDKTNCETEIKTLMQNKLNQLTTYIYPISENVSIMCDDDEYNEDANENSHNSIETMPLLNCVNDKLLCNKKNEYHQKTRYQIVDSWITLEENYRIGTHRESLEYLDIRENIFRDDHCRIISALSYLCHLINLIALICEIHLPKKLLFSELACEQITKKEFRKKIAKLNVNILFLCCLNRVNIQYLNPKQSLKNAKHLLDVVNFTTTLDNYLEIPNGFYKVIQNELLNDLKKTYKSHRMDLSCTDPHEECDFDFVEINIPDLILEIQQPASFLSSLVSSFYKVKKK